MTVGDIFADSPHSVGMTSHYNIVEISNHGLVPPQVVLCVFLVKPIISHLD